jgi:hypothetical protein
LFGSWWKKPELPSRNELRADSTVAFADRDWSIAAV